MTSLRRPTFLLADSQLLFSRGERCLPRRVAEALEVKDGTSFRAAYIGASNGDEQAFYDVFLAAMDGWGVHDCQMIRSRPTDESLAFLESADLVLLAGGDVDRGLGIMKSNGVLDRVRTAHATGAILIGVSAGATQLGRCGWATEDAGPPRAFEAASLLPYVVEAHGEPDWPGLNVTLPPLGPGACGIGIPLGGGAIVHPDWSLEPLRHALWEFSVQDDGSLRQALLLDGLAPLAPQESIGGRVPVAGAHTAGETNGKATGPIILN